MTTNTDVDRSKKLKSVETARLRIDMMNIAHIRSYRRQLLDTAFQVNTHTFLSACMGVQ